MQMTTPIQGAVNIRDFGATGDGRTKDTAAIQRAIDACAAARGGVVYCPPGTYLSGTIQLQSNVELHLEAGATILGSPDRADYIRIFTGQHLASPNPLYTFNYDQFLVCARNAHNVAITGRGMIDGNGRAFFVSSAERRKELGIETPTIDRLDAAMHEASGLPDFFAVRDWRPGPLVTLIDCQEVLLRDVHLVDSPGFAVWSVGCERVTVQAITIQNNRRTPNGDGIHLSCSRDVRISDCSIDTGDDCICAYTVPYWLGTPRPCENVTVTNCTLSTPCCGVRIGYVGDAPIRNFTLNNLVMHNCRTGIDLLCDVKNLWSLECEAPMHHGPTLENLSFSNLVMDTRKVAIHIWIGDNARRPAGIRNISISDVIATTLHTCYIGGSKAVPIEDVRINNMKLTVRGEVDERFADSVPYPVSFLGLTGIPHAFYLRHARNIELNNVRVAWGDIVGPWRSAVRAEQVENLDINGLISRQALPDSDAAAVHLTDVRGASLRGCRAEPGTGTFLRADGKSTRVRDIGNDLSEAKQTQS